MSRRPKNDPTVTLVIRDIPIKLGQSTVNAFPQVKGFLAAQLDRGVAAAIATEYARLTAKAMREGRVGTPKALTSRSAQTAVNAYWRWVETSYAARIAPVLRALTVQVPGLREVIGAIRRGSLVPPPVAPAVKLIPQPGWIQTAALNADTMSVELDAPPRTQWVPCNDWTLHVPRDPRTPVHVDPCETCNTIGLSDTQLDVIATAFESAWGHRNLFDVPAECPLFGQPPISDATAAAGNTKTVGRVVALIQPCALSDTVQAMHGSVSRDATVFRARVREGDPPDVIVVSRTADPVLFDLVLGTVLS